MNFFERFLGVFTEPEKTFKAVAGQAVWKDALVLLLVVLAAFTYLINPFVQKDTIALFEDNVQIKERMGERAYERALEQARNPSPRGRILRSSIGVPVVVTLMLLLQSLILFGLGRMTSTQGTFKQVFSVYLHAGFIDKVLGTAVRLVLVFLKKSSMQTTTSLAVLFPNLPPLSSGFIILSQLDFFQIWLFGVLGYGLASVFNIKLEKALALSYGFWVLKCLFNIGLGLLGRAVMG